MIPHRFTASFIALLLTNLISACGQKTALVLPETPPAIATEFHPMATGSNLTP